MERYTKTSLILAVLIACPLLHADMWRCPGSAKNYASKADAMQACGNKAYVSRNRYKKKMKKERMARQYAAKDKDGLLQLPQQFNGIAQRRAQGAATRFQTIKIAPAQAKNEIDFWSRQLSEHALFLHLGLEEKPFKEQGLALHNKFEAFRKNMTMQNLADILPLAQELRDYKVQVFTTLLSGKWLGWIFPLFARHIILELDYFVDKLNGIRYTDRDEIAFWNVINGEHAGFAAHLLDPSEEELFKKADNLSRKFCRVVKTEKEMMVQISLRSAKQLDAFNKDAKALGGKVKSVIHPVLLDHVIREGQRSIEMLNSLCDKQGAIYPENMK